MFNRFNELLVEVRWTPDGASAHKQEIKELIAAKTGKEVDIDVKCLEEGRRFEDSFIDIENMIHMDITIED